MPAADLAWAIQEFRPALRHKRAELAQAYYLGDHDLNFAKERFRDVFKARFQAVADNLCPAIIESIADRLELTGFTAEGAETDEEREQITGPVWQAWQRNRMDIRAPQVHRESLVTGDGYVIVWPDEATGLATIYPQHSSEMAVEYDPERPGVIRRAAKLWWGADKRIRVTVYLPDRVERYVGQRKSQSGWPTEKTKPDWFVGYRANTDGLDAQPVVANPYERVPVFHFPNRVFGGYGLDELRDVIPLQQALDKLFCDMMVASEFSGAVRRWAAGLETELDERTNQPKPFKPPPGWTDFINAPDSDTKFGTFATTALDNFIVAIENIRAEMARVSGVPLHYLFITKGDFPSGEAMKSAEARFSRKLRFLHGANGNVWEDAMSFAALIERRPVPAGRRLAAVWADPDPRPSIKDMADYAAVAKETAVPFEHIWRIAFGATEEQIAEWRRMLEERGGPPASELPPAE